MLLSQRPISIFLSLVISISCSRSDVSTGAVELEQPFYLETFVCNTDDEYTLVGDTIPVIFMEKEALGMSMKLYKNGGFLFEDTLFPNGFGALNFWEQKRNSNIQLSIYCNKKKYNLFVLNENMLLIVGYFESELYWRHPSKGWTAFDLRLYPNFISRYKKTLVFPEDEKISFVGENWDLLGNHYKGDSLVINYKNGFFEIDEFYPKTKLPNITYFER